MTVRKHNIETLKRLIAAHNFHTRDFLLTAGRVRPPKRERLRRRIAQLMFRCGLSAHDLHHHEAAAAYTQDRVHRDGEWQTEQHDVTEGFEAIFDLANAEVGWIKFPKGAAPEMALKPVEEDIGERPSGDHKEGLRLIVKIPGDDAGPRELISTAYAVWHGIDELHDQYLATEESTK